MHIAGCKIKVNSKSYTLKIWYDGNGKRAVYNKPFSKRKFGELIDEVKKISDIIEGGERDENI